MEANKGKFVGLPEAADSRMGGHFMCLWRLLRLRNVLIQLVTPPKYVEQIYKDDPSAILSWTRYHGTRSTRCCAPCGLIPLLRLGDTNGAVMGFQVKCTISEAVGPGIKAAFEQYEHELFSDFTKAAFVINPAFVDEAKVVMESNPSYMAALELIAGHMVSSISEDEQLAAVASVVEGVAEMQTKTGQYNRPSAWARTAPPLGRAARSLSPPTSCTQRGARGPLAAWAW